MSWREWRWCVGLASIRWPVCSARRIEWAMGGSEGECWKRRFTFCSCVPDGVSPCAVWDWISLQTSSRNTRMHAVSHCCGLHRDGKRGHTSFQRPCRTGYICGDEPSHEQFWHADWDDSSEKSRRNTDHIETDGQHDYDACRDGLRDRRRKNIGYDSRNRYNAWMKTDGLWHCGLKNLMELHGKIAWAGRGKRRNCRKGLCEKNRNW